MPVLAPGVSPTAAAFVLPSCIFKRFCSDIILFSNGGNPPK